MQNTGQDAEKIKQQVFESFDFCFRDGKACLLKGDKLAGKKETIPDAIVAYQRALDHFEKGLSYLSRYKYQEFIHKQSQLSDMRAGIRVCEDQLQRLKRIPATNNTAQISQFIESNLNMFAGTTALPSGVIANYTAANKRFNQSPPPPHPPKSPNAGGRSSHVAVGGGSSRHPTPPRQQSSNMAMASTSAAAAAAIAPEQQRNYNQMLQRRSQQFQQLGQQQQQATAQHSSRGVARGGSMTRTGGGNGQSDPSTASFTFITSMTNVTPLTGPIYANVSEGGTHPADRPSLVDEDPSSHGEDEGDDEDDNNESRALLSDEGHGHGHGQVTNELTLQHNTRRSLTNTQVVIEAGRMPTEIYMPCPGTNNKWLRAPPGKNQYEIPTEQPPRQLRGRNYYQQPRDSSKEKERKAEKERKKQEEKERKKNAPTTPRYNRYNMPPSPKRLEEMAESAAKKAQRAAEKAERAAEKKDKKSSIESLPKLFLNSIKRRLSDRHGSSSSYYPNGPAPRKPPRSHTAVNIFGSMEKKRALNEHRSGTLPNRTTTSTSYGLDCRRSSRGYESSSGMSPSATFVVGPPPGGATLPLPMPLPPPVVGPSTSGNKHQNSNASRSSRDSKNASSSKNTPPISTPPNQQRRTSDATRQMQQSVLTNTSSFSKQTPPPQYQPQQQQQQPSTSQEQQATTSRNSTFSKSTLTSSGAAALSNSSGGGGNNRQHHQNTSMTNQQQQSPMPPQRFLPNGLGNNNMDPIFAEKLRTLGITMDVLAEQSRRSGLDLDTVEFIFRYIVRERDDPSLGYDFEHIFGLNGIKKLLQDTYIAPRMYPRVYDRYTRHLTKGVLLHGFSGNGKNMLVRALANATNDPVFVLNQSTLIKDLPSSSNPRMNKRDNLVEAVFKLARLAQPSIVLIDKIDMCLPESIMGEVAENTNNVVSVIQNRKHKESFRTHLMHEIKKNATDPSSEVLVVGTTSRPMDVDKSVLLYLPLRLWVHIPEATTRADILLAFFTRNTHIFMSFPKHKYNEFIQRTQGMSVFEFESMLSYILMAPVRDLHKRGDKTQEQINNATHTREHTYADFEEGLIHFLPVTFPLNRREQEKWYRRNSAKIPLDMATGQQFN